MFDPTIYDNLKVVLEGTLYDYDREGRVYVSGRRDLVDLATMSRSFRMELRKQEGTCRAELELSSSLVDFASELRHMRLADELPGSMLRLTFWLAESAADQYEVMDGYLQEQWGEVAEVVHQRTSVLRAGGATEHQGEYRITLNFRDKVDENNIQDISPLVEEFIKTIEYLDAKGNSD